MKLFNIRVAQYMTGCKTAVIEGNDLFVSPAMYDLMQHSTEEELEKLLASIGTIDLSEERAQLLITKRKHDPLEDMMLRMRYE